MSYESSSVFIAKKSLVVPSRYFRKVRSIDPACFSLLKRSRSRSFFFSTAASSNFRCPLDLARANMSFLSSSRLFKMFISRSKSMKLNKKRGQGGRESRERKIRIALISYSRAFNEIKHALPASSSFFPPDSDFCLKNLSSLFLFAQANGMKKILDRPVARGRNNAPGPTEIGSGTMFAHRKQSGRKVTPTRTWSTSVHEIRIGLFHSVLYNLRVRVSSFSKAGASKQSILGAIRSAKHAVLCLRKGTLL